MQGLFLRFHWPQLGKGSRVQPIAFAHNLLADAARLSAIGHFPHWRRVLGVRQYSAADSIEFSASSDANLIGPSMVRHLI